jgi:Eco57I restriction-modification methylase/TaqI-like C-terminal specificity domain
VKQATAPLGALFDLIQAERVMDVFDAAPPKRPTEARPTTKERQAAYDHALALRNVFDGTFGHPIDIACGATMLPSVEPGQPADLFPSDRPEQATLFARSALDPQHRRLAQDLVDEARLLAHAHRFLHWELAFPNVWDNWLSPDPGGGFDAVIGNPPYVRQEQIRSLKPALKKAYRAYDGMADLYVYFYELGLRLLRPGGCLSYVVTNKWLRAGYAEELRGLLSSEGWLEAVADFGHAKKFFPGADVFPCVIVVRRPDGPDAPAETEVCQIPRDVVRLDRVSQDVSDKAFPLPRASFTRQGWALDPPEVAALMDKIRRAGVPLKEYAGVSPQYGIKTGFNEAFLIDTPTRDALVAADPKCAEIIKPYLRGQDIERWDAPWRGLWMIVLRSSANREWPWSHAGTESERLFADAYPSVHRHMSELKTALENRQDKGDFWWELRSCSYYRLFESPKIVYNDITWNSQFSLDSTGCYVNNTVYLLATSDVWLMAVLNAPAGWWFAWRAAQHGKDEALRYFNTFLENYPVPAPVKGQAQAATEAVARLSSIRQATGASREKLTDWYRVVLEISRPPRLLLNPFGMTADEFYEHVRKARGARKPLSAAAVQAVREEYAQTVQPMQAALREAEGLEWRLSDLVNEAYGLTPDEVRLMWATAPPRMPLVPDAEALEQGDEAAE